MPRYDDRRKRSTAPSGFNRKIARHNEFPDRNGAWAQIKYWSFSPTIFPNMISAVSPEAKPGDLVTVYDKEGGRFGHGHARHGLQSGSDRPAGQSGARALG